MLNEKVFQLKYEDIIRGLAKGQFACNIFTPKKKAVLYIYNVENPKEIIGTVYTKKDIMMFWAMLTELYEILVEAPSVILGKNLELTYDDLTKKFRDFFYDFISEFKPTFTLPGTFQFLEKDELKMYDFSKDILALDNSSSSIGEVSLWFNYLKENKFAMDIQIPSRYDRLHALEFVFKYVDAMEDKTIPKWLDIYRFVGRNYNDYQVLYMFYLLQHTDKKWTMNILNQYFDYVKKHGKIGERKF